MNPEIQTQARRQFNGWRVAANGTSLVILMCGLATLTLLRDIEVALGLLIAAALLDGIDGAMARRAGGATVLGARLDVIADFTTFGVASAALVIDYATNPPFTLWITMLTFLMAALARLWRSYQRGLEPHQGYIGLPMPAAATLLLGLSLTLPSQFVFLGALLTTALAISKRMYPTAGWLWREARLQLIVTLIIIFGAWVFSYRGGLLVAGLSYAAFPWLRIGQPNVKG